MPAAKTVDEKFWPNVYMTSDCWVWKGTKHNAGYGVIRLRNPRRQELAHRVAYKVLIGPIPEGTEIDHLCRNRACVRPDHLEAVTHKENCVRGNGFASWAKKTHCLHGHEFTEANTLIHHGRRECRECNILAQRELRKRRRIIVHSGTG